MQDQVLLSVTEILDDSTGIWAGDLCEFSIHSGDLEDFLKGHGQKGAEEICKTLDYLKKAVMEEYLPKSQETQEKKAATMKYKITKQAWKSIGKQAGWMKESQRVKWFEWEDPNSSNNWIINYRDIEPDEMYNEQGRSLSEKEIMRKMIVSIQNKFEDNKLTSAQIEYFIDKFDLESDFFDMVQETNALFRDEQRIEQRDMDMGLDDQGPSHSDIYGPEKQHPQY